MTTDDGVTTVPEREASGRTRRRAVVSALAGTLLEYYDYYLFGLASAVVFPRLFFPSQDPLVGTLLSFATFGVGFLLRPLGGILLGRYADRHGRRPVLVFTMILMGAASFAMGLLPTYAAIGVAAPLLLLVLRLAQGFATGGEMSSAATMALEYAPRDRRGFYGSFIVCGAVGGILLASGIMALVSLLPEESLLSWGWRIPFLLSAILVVVGLVIRLRVPETPLFEQERRREEIAAERAATAGAPDRRGPIRRAFARPRAVLLGTVFAVAGSLNGYVLTVFAPAYIVGQGGSPTLSYAAVMTASAVGVALAPVWGRLSDRIGRRKVYAGACIGAALTIHPTFLVFAGGNPVLVTLAMIVGYSVFGVALASLVHTILAESFGTAERATGIGIGYQFAAVLGGGFAPFTAQALQSAAGGAVWAVSLYVAVGCLLSAVAVGLLPEGAGRDLDEVVG